MDIRKVKKLIELLEESGIAEIEIKEGEESVRISRQPTGAVASHFPVYAPPPAPAAMAAVAMAGPATESSAAAASKTNDYTVQAPMVGTFYSAPAPGAKPFVQIGDEVKVGQVLCIIEAMKLFNEIECEVSGTVVKVIADDMKPVEYGQPLFLVDPA